MTLVYASEYRITPIDHSYLRQGQLTPVSQPSGSRNVSPLSPGPRPVFEEARPPTAGSGSGLPSGRRPGGYGGFEGRSSPALDAGFGQSPSQNGCLMQRMESITPGPFNAARRPSATSQASTVQQELYDRRNGSFDDLSRAQKSPTVPASASAPNIVPPRQPRQNGYGGFGAPFRSDEESEPRPLGSLNRSETFPKPSFSADAPSRTPSAPGQRPLREQQHERQHERNPSLVPPRKSLVRPRVPDSVDLAAEFGIGNPYHTPSDSASSGYSAYSSQPSYSSTQTSPARSQKRRDQTGNAEGDDEYPRRGVSLRPKDIQVEPLAPMQRPLRTPSPLVESPFAMSPQNDMTQSRRDEQTTASQPDDRGLTGQGLSSSPQREPGFFGARLQRNDTAPAWMGTSPPLPRIAPPQRKGSAQPGRGDCKACRLPIKGKSISSADGRLTGKYHKACFVCTTCYEPFSSAEFYVLDDKPYCEQHYHKLNGSLCGACSRGIEGQYLEDETSLKYHVGCFRCLDCGQSLSDGYFEVDGGTYCEKDALGRVQRTWNAAPPPAAAERSRFPPGPPRGGPGPRPRQPIGLPSHPGPRGRGAPNGPPPARSAQGLPRPGMGPGGPKLNKRMTRLGMM